MQTASNTVERSSSHLNSFPKRERCLIIPAETLYTIGQYDISPGAKWLYAILRTHTNREGTCRVYLETLAEESGQTVRTVRRQLTELRQAGLLLRERQGRGKANHYELTMIPEKPATFGQSNTSESLAISGRFLSEDRPKMVAKQAENGHSFKEEQRIEQEIEQAGLARPISNPFQKYSFPNECKKAFYLHRKKNTLSRFLEVLDELEKRNQPQIFYRALEKYLLKGENGDIYPVTILRDYLWKEMAQEAEFDRQEAALAEEQNQVEEAVQTVEDAEWEEEWQRKSEELEEKKSQQRQEFSVVVQEIQQAVNEQDQARIREIIAAKQEILQAAKLWLSETPEWKQYRECLLKAGFMPMGRGKGFWGKPAWDTGMETVMALWN